MIANLRRVIAGEEQEPMVPHYRGFHGTIEQKTGKSDVEWALTSVLMMGNPDIPPEMQHRLHDLSTGTLLAVEL